MMLHVKAKRAFFLTAGVISLGVGIIGIFTPLLPTTPFVLFTAWCFSKSSEKFHTWIVTHRVFGPLIENWKRDRSIPLRAKYMAVGMLALSALIVGSKAHLPVWVRASSVLSCLGVAIFVSTRKTAQSTSKSVSL